MCQGQSTPRPFHCWRCVCIALLAMCLHYIIALFAVCLQCSKRIALIAQPMSNHEFIVGRMTLTISADTVKAQTGQGRTGRASRPLAGKRICVFCARHVSAPKARVALCLGWCAEVQRSMQQPHLRGNAKSALSAREGGQIDTQASRPPGDINIYTHPPNIWRSTMLEIYG